VNVRTSFAALIEGAPGRRAGFVAGDPLVVARAPGRLDVIGGIADYSGSLVLQLPLQAACHVALQRCAAPQLSIVSRRGADLQRAEDFSIAMAELLALDEAAAAVRLRADPARRWAAYVAGAFVVLAQARGAAFAGGARLLIDSEVPEGSGVSSSAAVEVATMQAIAAAFDLELAPRELALLCQRVENRIAGAPCGVMDQMTAACGRRDHLLALLCRPAELRGQLPIPGAVAFWGIDSGVRHAVGGADYAGVRAAAFIGRKLLAARHRRAELQLTDLDAGDFERDDAPHLPEGLTGRAFLERWRDHGDAATAVDPQQSYAVRAASRHPVHEHARAQRFAALLPDAADEDARRELGALLRASHASYGACGLGTPQTDRLAAMVDELGPAAGLYGARISGGGSGGTVVVLGRRDAGARVAAIAARYGGATPAMVFGGSSDGAVQHGVKRLPTRR